MDKQTVRGAVAVAVLVVVGYGGYHVYKDHQSLHAMIGWINAADPEMVKIRDRVFPKTPAVNAPAAQ